jgi:hypothetical protein
VNGAVQVLLEFDNLACETKFTIVAAAADESGNIVQRLLSAQVSTPDVQPPRFIAATPSIRAAGNGSVWLDVALDEPGTVGILVSPPAASRPRVPEPSVPESLLPALIGTPSGSAWTEQTASALS